MTPAIYLKNGTVVNVLFQDIGIAGNIDSTYYKIIVRRHEFGPFGPIGMGKNFI